MNIQEPLSIEYNEDFKILKGVKILNTNFNFNFVQVKKYRKTSYSPNT